MAKKYPLAAILRIRVIRQEAAEQELKKRKEEAAAALKKVEKQEWRIEKYKEWRKPYEDQLFKAIIGKLGKKGDVTDVKAKVDINKQREEEHEKRLKKFQDEHKKAQEMVDMAFAAYRTAFFNVQKIKEHKDNWVEVTNK